MTDPDVPKLIEVAPRFHVRQEIDNMAWIDLGGFAVVVDTLEHAEKEAAVFDAIAETLGDTPIRYVLNTHTHYDHVALNAAFVRRCGSEIVNAETTDIPPEGKWFTGDRRRLQMLHTPGSHTREDCILWCPEDRVLLTGDLFGWGLIPLTTSLRDESAGRLVGLYERMIAFDAATVVPGHGPLCDTATLVRWVEYFRRLRRDAVRLTAEGLDDDAIRARLGPPEDMQDWWRFTQWKHADTRDKVLRSVRRGFLHAE